MVIYFLGHSNQSVVKIARTKRAVSRRMDEHAGRGPGRDENRLIFLAAVPGINSDETAVHNYFKAAQLEGEREWFTATEELLGYLRWLRMQPFAYRTLEEADDQLSRSPAGINGAHWLPSPDRSIAEFSGEMTFDSLNKWANVIDHEPVVTGDDYYTDARIIDAARATLGGIDLDPATHPVANRAFIRAPHIYTFETNGLAHDWAGRVWVNPPFGKWDEWGPKIAREWASGRVTSMCALMASRSVTAQANTPIWDAASAVCFTRGRIPFWGPKSNGSPDDGHAIFYFGSAVAEFSHHFQRIGHVSLLRASGVFTTIERASA